MKKVEFTKIVEEGIKAIPEGFRDKLSNVQLVVEEKPSPAQFQKLNLSTGSLLFGLYEGIPQTKRGMGYSGVLPDKITIFQAPIEQVAGGSKERIKQIVKDTVYHEIAHHFGTNEERIRQIEMRRKNSKKFN
jgi:predicted Zn-dependent protease with MMP-like domain